MKMTSVKAMDILKLRPPITRSQVKLAWKTEIKKCHPDICSHIPNAHYISLVVNEAKDVLLTHNECDQQINKRSAKNCRDATASSYSDPIYPMVLPLVFYYFS
jgi:hypothetical protein